MTSGSTGTGRAFIDSNVFVYAVDDAEPNKRAVARRVLSDEAGRSVISTQVLREFYAVATRKLRTPLTSEDAEARARELAELPVVSCDAAMVLSAMRLSRTAQLSLWDALIVHAARVGGCDRLLTEDLAAGATIAGVRVINPFVAPR